LAIQILQESPRVVVHAVDPTPSAIRLAQKKAKKKQVAPVFAESRAESLPFPDLTFDRAICSLALHHIPDEFKGAALAEIRRVLRPDGQFILADFETTSSWLFWGKCRSKSTLREWLLHTQFNIKHVEQRIGVYAYCSEPAAVHSSAARTRELFKETEE
jgi:ubiquinone/menaquinone biosynthesis C-methylase UbiE